MSRSDTAAGRRCGRWAQAVAGREETHRPAQANTYFHRRVLRHIRDVGRQAVRRLFPSQRLPRGEDSGPRRRSIRRSPSHSRTAAAFYSGLPEAAVVTLDGEGDLGVHHTSSLYRDGRLRCIHVSDDPGTSSGLFYMDVTELLGFRPLRHEGKVLGLAAFGDPEPLLASFGALCGSPRPFTLTSTSRQLACTRSPENISPRSSRGTRARTSRRRKPCSRDVVGWCAASCARPASGISRSTACSPT
jgi:hypothetical protein